MSAGGSFFWQTPMITPKLGRSTMIYLSNWITRRVLPCRGNRSECYSSRRLWFLRSPGEQAWFTIALLSDKQWATTYYCSKRRIAKNVNFVQPSTSLCTISKWKSVEFQSTLGGYAMQNVAMGRKWLVSEQHTLAWYELLAYSSCGCDLDFAAQTFQRKKRHPNLSPVFCGLCDDDKFALMEQSCMLGNNNST